MKISEYIDFLKTVYLKSPAIALTCISGNTTFEKAGDKRTLELFDSLDKLMPNERFKEIRTEKWWNNRFEILAKFFKKGLITLEQFEKYTE